MKTEEEYNAEVLQLMRDLYPTLKGEERERAERLFPELKELEDEKVRKELIEQVIYIVPNKNEVDVNGNTLPCYITRINKYIAWLKKQGEQKPVNINYISGIREELLDIENNAENIDGLTESQWVAIRAAHRILGECITKEQKPAWSEEDEKTIDEAVECLGNYAEYVQGGFSKQHVLDLASRVESLKDRYTWKPSELPHWKKNVLPNNTATGFNSEYFCYNGYLINYKELFEKLPKDD